MLVCAGAAGTISIMMTRRDVVCAICGLAACAHLAALGATDAAHPHQSDARPAVTVEALPVEPDHAHQDYDRAVRILDADVTVSGTSTVHVLDADPGEYRVVGADLGRAVYILRADQGEYRVTLLDAGSGRAR